MKLPKLAINNNQFTLVVVIMLVLPGIISLDPQVSESGTSTNTNVLDIRMIK